MALPTALNIDVAVDDVDAMLNDLTSKRAVAGLGIERLRQALYQQGGVDRRRAAAIFLANRTMQACSDDWSEFYLEVLTGFFLQHQGNSIVLPVDLEKLLLAWLGGGVSIGHPNERRLISRILLKASIIPPLVEQRALDALKENLLHQSERWLGVGERSAGIIDVLDMQLIRRLAYGPGGQCARSNDLALVTFLLDLERHATQFIDQEGWRELLMGCVLRHLANDPLNPVDKDLPWDVELKARLKALLGENYPSEKAVLLLGDILSASQVGAVKGEDLPIQNTV